ncbi:MAG: DUF4430 domain-containing protein [bacterium]|nr:DUF4430 domain-containing protein [bacterium]
MMKKFAAVLTAAAMASAAAPAVFAEETDVNDINVVVSVEKFTLGAGYIVEPEVITVADGTNAADAVFAVFGKNGVEAESPSYLTKVADSDTEINIPQPIVDALGGEDYIEDEKADPNYLAAEDYTVYSGWMYTVNNVIPSVMMNAYELKDNDVIRVQYTTYGWGEDLLPGASWGYCPQMTGVEFANKDALTAEIAKLRSEYIDERLKSNDVYNEAFNTAITFGVSQADADEAKNKLTELSGELKAADEAIRNAYLGAQAAMRKDALAYNGEWKLIALSRGEYDWADAANSEYYDAYYNDVVEKLKADRAENKEEDYKMQGPKSVTDYARTVIALTAIGRTAEDVGGYNLIEEFADFDTVSNYINSLIYTLIAIDTHGYKIPNTGAANPTTREKLVDGILENANDNGTWGWMTGSSDADMTAMAVQSLAPYYNSNENVKAVVDKALAWLSEQQCASGGYSSYGSENPETAAQVLAALCALGIDADTDERFVKGVNTIPKALTEYAIEGGYVHSLSETKPNAMATVQTAYALASYYRVSEGRNSLYDMSDIKFGTEITGVKDGKAEIYSTKELSGDLIVKAADGSVRVTRAEIKRGETSLDAADAAEIYIWNTLEGMLPLCGKWSK